MSSACPSGAHTHRFRFGSFDLRLTADGRYVDLLPASFRVWPEPDHPAVPDADLVVVAADEARARAEQVQDRMTMTEEPGRIRVTTTVTDLDVDTSGAPVRARLVVHPRGQAPAFVDHYVVINLRALLRFCGRLQLHGGAVAYGDRAAVFLGDKGAGKSTLALAFGRAGATVLADDQLHLHDDGARVTVSGVDGMLRLTEATERHFFAEPLPTDPREFGGALKKEVRLCDHVRADAGAGYEPTLLCFPHVRGRVRFTPISRTEAAQRVLGAVAPMHRFASASDQLATMRSIARFVRGVAVFDLELSPDLEQLDRVVAVVEEHLR